MKSYALIIFTLELYWMCSLKSLFTCIYKKEMETQNMVPKAKQVFSFWFWNSPKTSNGFLMSPLQF